MAFISREIFDPKVDGKFCDLSFRSQKWYAQSSFKRMGDGILRNSPLKANFHSKLAVKFCASSFFCSKVRSISFHVLQPYSKKWGVTSRKNEGMFCARFVLKISVNLEYCASTFFKWVELFISTLVLCPKNFPLQRRWEIFTPICFCSEDPPQSQILCSIPFRENRRWSLRL